MRIIKPSVEILEQGPGLEGIYKQIERCGRVCYKSEDKITDDSAEKSLCQGRGAKHAAADGPCRLAEDGHLRGVAAEVCDIALYPLQGVNLIQQAIVA